MRTRWKEHSCVCVRPITSHSCANMGCCARKLKEERMDGTEKVERNYPVVLDVLASENRRPIAPTTSSKFNVLPPSVRFPEENAFSACGFRGAPFQRLRLAVLIDGDNQALAPVENFLKKLPAYGNVTMGRVFGNWSKPAFGAWSDFCRRTGFSARQQHDYVVGKNATDIALVIDAMELAFARNVEGFVLITADSDFTPLAVRLRELGFVVIGAGRAAAASLAAACTQYHHLEGEPAWADCTGLSEPDRVRIADQSTSSTVPPAEQPSQEWCKGRAEEIARKLNSRGSIVSLMMTSGSASNRKLAYHKVLGELWAHCQINGWTPIAAVGFYVSRRLGSFHNKWIGVKKYPQFFGKNPNLYEVWGPYYRLRSAWYDLPPLKGFPFVLPKHPSEEEKTEVRPDHSVPAVRPSVPEHRVEPSEKEVEQGTLFVLPDETVPTVAKTKLPSLRMSRRMIEPVLPGLDFEKDIPDNQTVLPVTCS